MATGSRSTRDRSRDPGAYTAGDGDGHRKRGGWLWWLPGLLALLLLGALLLGLLGGGGSLTARNESLLPVPAGGLAAYQTQTATGKEVAVQSLVKDEGFWVGSSRQDRVYVEYGGDVGVKENQGFERAVGDKVNLTGPVRPAPENPAQTLNLPDQDARQVSEQGGYINADNAEIL